MVDDVGFHVLSLSLGVFLFEMFDFTCQIGFMGTRGVVYFEDW